MGNGRCSESSSGASCLGVHSLLLVQTGWPAVYEFTLWWEPMSSFSLGSFCVQLFGALWCHNSERSPSFHCGIFWSFDTIGRVTRGFAPTALRCKVEDAGGNDGRIPPPCVPSAYGRKSKASEETFHWSTNTLRDLDSWMSACKVLVAFEESAPSSSKEGKIHIVDVSFLKFSTQHIGIMQLSGNGHQGCPNADCRIQERSMEIRNPDIDASWYTGRGIRPVGRFGRRASEVRRGSDYPSHRFCIPVEENDDSSLDE
ncbi:PRRP protein, partial [Polypterus senegalus]|nr:PRRP protein [Polypterus senegalus]